ncbi:COMM domain-containing protein 3-like [Scleropages formosus]|uniref:COMM domain-containing protein 3 n=1 Tax=Scleropages formosus TaxID=113540 RepID=A0A0P7YXM9_SCLFO|nr:COMM domain-containing protein 3-like [Scleropages formosus]
MELSEFVLKGLQYLADPVHFSDSAFSTLVEASFHSLLHSDSSHTVLDNVDLERIDQALLKHCHGALTTCTLECVKQNADRATISTCLEDLKFDSERIDVFYSLYQKNKSDLENIMSSIGRCPPHIIDASWRLEYQIKNSHLHKVNQPSYLITLNLENGGTRSTEELSFSCTMEQLQVLA